jgi:hypothetical protein
MSTHELGELAQTALLFAMAGFLLYAAFAVRQIVKEAAGNLRLMLERQRDIEAKFQRMSARLETIEDELSRATELRRIQGGPPSS